MSLKENIKMKRLVKSLSSVVAVSVALGLGACKPKAVEESPFTVGGRFATDGTQLGGFGADELAELLNPSGASPVRTGGAWASPLVFDLGADRPATEGAVLPTAGTSLKVGSTTELDSDMLPGWNTNAAVVNIRNLVWGAGTVVLTEAGTYEYNPVVLEKVEVTSADNFDRTYKFTLRDDLVYSVKQSGSSTLAVQPITAKDYVFSILFNSSADLAEASRNSAGNITNRATAGIDLVGYTAYNTGVGTGAARTSNDLVFPGVRLIDDYEFSITVKGEMFPYFYEKTLAGFSPQPMNLFLGNDADVVDTAGGAKIVGINQTKIVQNVDNTTAKTGQRWNPTFFTGAYYLENYNDSTKIATLKANPNYKGQFKLLEVGGVQKKVFPKIETIVMVKTIEATQMAQLGAGEIDFLPQINGGATISQGKALTGINHHVFERNGYGFIHFHTDIGPTQYIEVRHAIAYLLDRTEFAEAFTGGNGGVVHGPYGLAQWMYQQREEELNAKLNPYSKNLDTALELLISGGWVFDANGKAYSGTGVRHKLMKDGETLMPLELEWLSSPNNPVSELIAAMLPSEAVKVGMKINQSVQEFSVLLPHYYGRTTPRQYHMFNLAGNFTPVYDQFYAFHPGYKTAANFTMLTDARLFRAFKELREVEGTNTDEYADKFVKAIVEWNRILPQVPLYSDLYHAFYKNTVQELRTTSLWNWDNAVVDAYIGSPSA